VLRAEYKTIGGNDVDAVFPVAVVVGQKCAMFSAGDDFIPNMGGTFK
jgi:hypothetical protein